MKEKSKSYKIPSEYLSKPIPVIIQNKNINKRIANQIKRNREIKAKNLEFAQSDYFKKFNIDFDGASKAIWNKTISELRELPISIRLRFSEIDIINILECKGDYKNRLIGLRVIEDGKDFFDVLHRYMLYMTRVNAIKDGFLFFKRNETNGRLDSNLTSLPSFLRPYIFSTEKLFNIDIVNSQPFFLYTLLRNDASINPIELKRYSDLVISGTLYEFLLVEYEKQTQKLKSRNDIKLILFKIIYSKNGSYIEYKRFFGKLFPTILNYINKTNSVKNNELAILLQKIEAHTILDTIMPILKGDGIVPYTIHDSFLCKESEVEKIKTIFNNKLFELFGISPTVHISLIEEIHEDEILRIEDLLEYENESEFKNIDNKEIAA